MTVSVITPVYNAAARLPECLVALRTQNVEDLQIILVDDGSTDGSGELCDAAARQDTRIEVVHQENAGPAAARNAGLDRARGEWVAFVDAGDLVEPDYLEGLLAVAEDSSADLVVSDCMLVEDGVERRFGHVVADMTYESRDELFQDFLNDRVPWSLWAKLYRAELFEGVRFDPGDYIAEDLDVNARIFARPGLRLVTTGLSGYRYYVEEGSVDHSFTERHLCQFDVFERVVSLVHDEGIRTITSPESFYEERILGCLRKALDAHAMTPTIKAAFKQAIARHRADVLADKTASPSLKRRLAATCLGLGFFAVLHKLHP